MKIHISQTTHELLGPDYKTADRGEIVVKGKGNRSSQKFASRPRGRAYLDVSLCMNPQSR